MQFPFCFILICKILQFLVKSYWFRQLIIIFQKVDTLRLLKFYIMFCLLPRCQISVFLGSNSWTKFLGPMESLICKYLETKVLGQLSEFESVIVDQKTLDKIFRICFLLAGSDFAVLQISLTPNSSHKKRRILLLNFFFGNFTNK